MNDLTLSPFEQLSLDELRARKSVKWRRYPPDVLPLWIAEMDTPLASPIKRVLTEAVELGDTGYVFADEFVDAFVGFADRRFGWTVDPSAPLATSDVMSAMKFAVQAVTDVGDTVVVSTPIYHPFFTCLDRLSRVTVRVSLTDTDRGLQFDLNKLEAAFAAGAKAYLLCNPHNPSGIVFTRDQLVAIADLAAQYDVVVIADEIHAPLTMPGVDHVSFLSLDHESAARGFVATAASKAFNLAGLKAALLIPGPAADRSRLPDDAWVGTGLFGAIASKAAFMHGDSWLDEVRAGLADRHTLLQSMLGERLPEARYTPPQGTYLAWIDVNAYQLGDDPAATFLKDGKVALYSGHVYGDEGRGYVRFNVATSKAIIVEAVERMAEAVKRS